MAKPTSVSLAGPHGQKRAREDSGDVGHIPKKPTAMQRLVTQAKTAGAVPTSTSARSSGETRATAATTIGALVAAMAAAPNPVKMRHMIRLAEALGQTMQVEFLNHFLVALKRKLQERAEADASGEDPDLLTEVATQEVIMGNEASEEKASLGTKPKATVVKVAPVKAPVPERAPTEAKPSPVPVIAKTTVETSSKSGRTSSSDFAPRSSGPISEGLQGGAPAKVISKTPSTMVKAITKTQTQKAITKVPPSVSKQVSKVPAAVPPKIGSVAAKQAAGVLQAAVLVKQPACSPSIDVARSVNDDEDDDSDVDHVRTTQAIAKTPSQTTVTKVASAASSKSIAKVPAIPAKVAGAVAKLTPAPGAVAKQSSAQTLDASPQRSKANGGNDRLPTTQVNATSLANPLTNTALQKLVKEISANPVCGECAVHEARLTEVLQQLLGGVAKSPKDWVAAWQAMVVPSDLQVGVLQRFLNMVFVRSGDAVERASLAVAALVKSQWVRLRSVEEVLSAFGPNLDGILAVNEDAWQLYPIFLSEVFPSQWGWSRVGWSWSNWWRYLMKCIATLEPSKAFDVVSMVVRLQQERESAAAGESRLLEGDRLQQVVGKLKELGECGEVEVTLRLSRCGVETTGFPR